MLELNENGDTITNKDLSSMYNMNYRMCIRYDFIVHGEKGKLYCKWKFTEENGKVDEDGALQAQAP